jgi:hypothetical protein
LLPSRRTDTPVRIGKISARRLCGVGRVSEEGSLIYRRVSEEGSLIYRRVSEEGSLIYSGIRRIRRRKPDLFTEPAKWIPPHRTHHRDRKKSNE